MSKKTSYAQKHMEGFASLYSDFTQLEPFKHMEDDNLVMLFTTWMETYQKNKENKRQASDEKASEKQIGFVKGLLRDEYLSRSDVPDDLTTLSRQKASSLIAQGVKVREVAEEKAENGLPF